MEELHPKKKRKIAKERSKMKRAEWNFEKWRKYRCSDISSHELKSIREIPEIQACTRRVPSALIEERNRISKAIPGSQYVVSRTCIYCSGSYDNSPVNFYGYHAGHRKTTWACTKCKIPLCRKPLQKGQKSCYEKWHEDRPIRLIPRDSWDTEDDDSVVSEDEAFALIIEVADSPIASPVP